MSIHRSNNRHIMRIKTSNISDHVKDIPDDNINTILDYGNKKNKVEAHCHITLMPFCQLHQMYCKIYNTISFSYFVLNKPFYITSTTNTEMEMCMCGNCLNIHCLYAAIRKQTDIQLPYSLSGLLCMNMKCNKETETSFYHLDCILGKCKNKYRFEILYLKTPTKTGRRKFPVVLCLKKL